MLIDMRLLDRDYDFRRGGNGQLLTLGASNSFASCLYLARERYRTQ